MSASTERTAAPSAQHAASLIGAHARFGAVHALRGVDLDIGVGRVTVLLGPNGAGKTTAVRLLLGQIAPTAGSARIFGHDPRTAAARTRVGAMMQVANVPEILRVSEHIDTFRSYYPRPLTRAALLDAAGLEALEHRQFGTLSGGEKQRLLFALALAGDPALLFLDEPTVGMDVETRRAFWERIRALRAAGRAVLLTTHYLEEADALADRIVVIDRGTVVADGAPAEIRSTVALKRVRCTTSLDLESIRALPDVHTATAEGKGVTTILTAHAEQVVRTLLAHDPRLHGLEVHGAALEEAFLALTTRRKEVAA